MLYSQTIPDLPEEATSIGHNERGAVGMRHFVDADLLLQARLGQNDHLE